MLEYSKKDFWRAVDNFYMKGSFVKSMNATFIALIPKKNGAVEVKDFRAISLLGCVYTIISKLLAGRLRQSLASWFLLTRMLSLKEDESLMLRW